MLPLEDRFEDEDHDKARQKKADSSAMRILTNWIAMHDGVDDKLRAIVDRHFFVVELPDAEG